MMSLATILIIAAAVYVVVGIAVFFANASIGPVTIGLAALRAVLWPLAMMGLIPGRRLPMD